MTQHTPGPWRIVSERANSATSAPLAHEIRGGSWVVVRLGSLHTEVQKADARLIASAPDLLAALEHAVRFFDQLKPEDVARYRAAIAKATGGAS
jgi:hypothetical protein